MPICWHKKISLGEQSCEIKGVTRPRNGYNDVNFNNAYLQPLLKFIYMH